MKFLDQQSISAMPSVEKRKRSIGFGYIARLMNMSVENDFHWLLYSTYRDSFLISFAFSFLILVRLYASPQILNEDIVMSELRLFSIGTSIPIILGIIPYYYMKAKRVVGFSNIDYMEIFPRKIPRVGWTLDRWKIVKKAGLLVLVLFLIIPLGWTSIALILDHYHALDSFCAVLLALAAYTFVGSPMLAMVGILFIMIYQQYKNYFDEIPITREMAEKE